jgi:probable rRNA maturation factor
MIDITNESGYRADEAGLVALTRFALGFLHIHPDAEVSILLVDIDTMSAYHQRFMEEPGPTDVLSFPMDELRPGTPGHMTGQGVLGDIVLCPEVIAAQAALSSRTPAGEANYLLIHGLLHLVGFDHGTPDEHKEMFDLNDTIISAWAAEQHPSRTHGRRRGESGQVEKR